MGYAWNKERAFANTLKRANRNVSTGCLELSLGETRRYGETSLKGRKKTTAHRFIYEYHHGPLEKHLVVRHLCNNPKCIEISHLASGSQKENIADAKKAGRRADGEKHPMAKLTSKEVAVMKKLFSMGISAYRVSRIWEMDNSTICDIKAGKLWKEVQSA